MKKFFGLAIVAVFLLAATSAFADSYPVGDQYIALKISDSISTEVFFAPADAIMDGRLTGFFDHNGWVVDAVVKTYPLLGNTVAPRIDLNTIAGGSGILTVMASVVGFTGPVSPGGFNFAVGGTTDGTVQFSAYWDYMPGTFFTTANELFNSGVLDPVALQFAYAFNGSIPEIATAYTLMAQMTTGNTSFDIDFRVPEPTSLILLGLGLLGIAGIRRKH